MSEFSEEKSVRHDLQTIAFYNLENLFDYYDDSRTYDNDFLPIAIKKWTPKRYENKLHKLSFAISNIGKKETGKHPAIVGIAEVENAKNIQDLIKISHLKNCNYSYVHYDSLDERGIDVALIYDTTAFDVSHSEVFRIYLENEAGLPDYTRDILWVSGFLDGEAIHVIVNHWSSRREGEKETEPKRLLSSDKVNEIITNLRLENPEAKIIVMGDFNDDPSNNSIKNLVNKSNLYNPMNTLRSFSRGSTMHNRQWNLFDQIIFSTNFFNTRPNKLEFKSANIFDENFLKLFKGKYKGSPFRTYLGTKYQGGYSDHFPVYVIFKK
ncbi:endonuclease [Mariniflexile sp.]|uniref:endonuclease/exonuclease/phosphatase family protein n=1 Tax=Mariniflexile sp. TaxID=1979402 RepID=UPI0035618D0D